MEEDSQGCDMDRIHDLLERLWSLRREDNEFEQIECELMNAVQCNPTAAHSHFSITGSPSELYASRLLWHVCALGCSFDAIVRVHYENETACRERQALQGSLPLHVACKALCDVNSIRFLVKQYPDARDEPDEQMNYPLHIVLLTHPNRADLVFDLLSSKTSKDLAVPWRSRFPMDILDALIRTQQSIALESNPMNTNSQNVIFSSTRFHGFCSQIRESMHITVGQQHLEETLIALSRYRVPLVALNIKFFEEIPVQSLGAIDTLRYVFLQKGTITHEALTELLHLLARQRHLTRLHIRSSRTLRGASPMALLGLAQLQHLDLGHNSVGPSLAEPIAQVLLDTTTLQHLDIGGNHIGEPGMHQIYSALCHNKTLQRLDIMGESADGLLAMLENHNSTLQSIRASHDVQEQVAYWGMANQCGRGKLCLGNFTKHDFVELLLEARDKSTKVGFSEDNMFYALLATNPAVWST
jgi:Leucine Rich repeat